MPHEAVLNQLNIVVRDMQATIAFYRRLGLPVEAEDGAQRVALHLPNGLDQSSRCRS